MHNSYWLRRLLAKDTKRRTVLTVPTTLRVVTVQIVRTRLRDPIAPSFFYHRLAPTLYLGLVGGLLGRIAFLAHACPVEGVVIVCISLATAGYSYCWVHRRWLRKRKQKELEFALLVQNEIDRLNDLEFETIDQLEDGEQFELYMLRVFQDQGYQVTHTGRSHDQGCDLLLRTRDETIVCQCKKWKSSVGSKDVRTLGAMAHYGAQRAIVVTISDFTRDARDLQRTSPRRLTLPKNI
jgi:Restriction endonuclease